MFVVEALLKSPDRNNGNWAASVAPSRASWMLWCKSLCARDHLEDP